MLQQAERTAFPRPGVIAGQSTLLDRGLAPRIAQSGGGINSIGKSAPLGKLAWQPYLRPHGVLLRTLSEVHLTNGAADAVPDTPRFVHTVLAHHVPRGRVVIPAFHGDQIRIGQILRIGEIASPNTELVSVAFLDSICAASPTKNDHAPGELVTMVLILQHPPSFRKE